MIIVIIVSLQQIQLRHCELEGHNLHHDLHENARAEKTGRFTLAQMNFKLTE